MALALGRAVASEGPENAGADRRPRGRLAAFARGMVRSTFLWTLLVLVGVRLALPFALERYVDHVLDRVPDYAASIEGLEVNLWRGAYEIEGLDVLKVDGGVEAPLFEAARVDLAVDWRNLLRGRVVGELDLLRPVLNVVTSADEGVAQTGKDRDWGARIEALYPFRIERLVVRDGVLMLRMEQFEPNVDVFVEDVFVDGHDIGNTAGSDTRLTARLEVAGRPFGTGEFVARAAFDPVAASPDFELDVVVERVDLRDLNDLILATADVDVERGSLALYARLTARDGRLEGAMKMLLEDVQVFRFGEIDDPAEALSALWEALVGGAAELLENQPRDRIALETPLRGRVEEPGTSTWSVARSVVENAFIRLIRPGIEGDGAAPERFERRHASAGSTPQGDRP